MNILKFSLLMVACAGLFACQTAPETTTELPDRIPKQIAKKVRIGKPYTIRGQRYYPTYNPNYDKTGVASWYGPGFHGKKTANGETYNQYAMTAAHPTLPLPSLVRVTNLENNQSTIVRINDRGPFAHGRIIDLSKKSAETIGIKGIANVRVQYLPQETEQLWADNNFRPSGIPTYAQAPVQYVPTVEERIEPEQSIAAEPAPIMSVSSMQVANLDPLKAPSSTVEPPIVTASQFSPATPPPFKPEDQPFKPIAAHGRDGDQPEVIFTQNEDAGSKEINVSSVARDDGGGYFIQAGAFSSQMNAENLVDKISTIGRAFTEPLVRSTGVLYRVKIGPYGSRAQASDLLHELFKMGIKDATVISMK